MNHIDEEYEIGNIWYLINLTISEILMVKDLYEEYMGFLRVMILLI